MKKEWNVVVIANRVCILSSDFTHDTLLTISGDFGTRMETLEYADGLADKLNKEILEGEE